jgi:hypothetical protein
MLTFSITPRSVYLANVRCRPRGDECYSNPLTLIFDSDRRQARLRSMRCAEGLLISLLWLLLWQVIDFPSCFSYVGAGFPLFAGQMYRKLGTPGAGSLVAGLATVGILVPVLLIHYGPRLRALSQCESVESRGLVNGC